MRIGRILSAPLLGLLLCLPNGVAAQALPSTDVSFTTRSADNDPDLIVVREAYEPQTRLQSLYLRVNDGTADRQVFSGRLVIRGATVASIVHRTDEMAISDGRFGLVGMNYGGEVAGRGLDGLDPSSHSGVVGNPDDAFRIEDANTVRFYLNTAGDIDDFRVLVRYPGEPGPASFDVLLFNPERPDPLGWPLTHQAGIQVGSLVDAVPDDGDYSEVFEVRRIKLRIEDLDVVEDGLDLGIVPLEGGTAGPQNVTLDNFSNDADLDQDNGFDQNGLISPIPAGSDLEHLVFRAPELVNELAGAVLPPEAMRIQDPPARLAVGSSVAVPVSVVVPAGMPGGAYVGRLEIFEDNDSDGLRDGGEPFDLVNVQVVVVAPPDAAFDLGLPDFGPQDLALPDGPAPFDAGNAEAGPTDGPMVTPEAGPEGGVSDAVADGPPGDRPDASIDGPTPADLGPDAPRPDATGPDAEAGVKLDAGTADAVVDFGTPRGGAWSCRTSGGGASAAWFLTLLAVRARRRRGPGGRR